MRKLEDFQKRKTEHEQELARLAGNLEKLNQQRSELDEQINAAIDAENLDTVERLTAKETELDNRIRAAEKIMERKREKSGISLEEAAAANNTEMKKYQEEISAAMKDAEKYQRLHFESLIRAGEFVQAARSVRADYLQLVGARDDNGAFDTVRGGLSRGSFDSREREIINAIKPGAMNLVNSLR